MSWHFWSRSIMQQHLVAADGRATSSLNSLFSLIAYSHLRIIIIFLSIKDGFFSVCEMPGEMERPGPIFYLSGRIYARIIQPRFSVGSRAWQGVTRLHAVMIAMQYGVSRTLIQLFFYGCDVKRRIRFETCFLIPYPSPFAPQRTPPTPLLWPLRSTPPPY